MLQAELIEEPMTATQSPSQTMPPQSYTVPTSAPAPETPQVFPGELPSFTSPAPSSEKSGTGKKILKAVIAVIAILAVLGGGYLALFGKGGGLPGVDYAAKGREAYEQEDYENAVTYLEKAYEKDPEDEDVLDMLYTSHQTLAMDSYYSGDYSGSEPHLLRMAELAGDGSLDSGMAAFYTEWLERITRGSESSDPAKVLKNAESFLDGDSMSYYTSFFSDISTPEELAEMIAVFYEGNRSPGICLLLDRHEDIVEKAVKNSGVSMYTVGLYGYKYPFVVFRPQRGGEGYSAYYGDLDDSGARNGIGAIFCYRNNSGDPYLYYYLSGWASDLPNGQFVEIVLKDENFAVYNSYTGNLYNSYYNGYITTRFDDGVEYQSFYMNGIVSPIRTDEEGRTVIAIATDGSDKYLYSTVPGTDNTQYGVDEY
jgi:tetratricopeptide (TPR) repeat protein